MFHKDFYPTPSSLAERMIAKVKRDPKRILEPSAGKGDLIEALRDYVKVPRANFNLTSKPYKHAEIFAMEINEDLQATLRGKNINLLDSDFLSFDAPDKFDLIIANPPFSSGDAHLLKACQIMYSGEIVFLLNAETLRHPHTNTRKRLAEKLEELDADIEFIQHAFVDAERPTGVEVALIYINIVREVEDDLFADCDDLAGEFNMKFTEQNELSTGHTIEELVAEYREIIHHGTEAIVGHFKKIRKVGKYLSLRNMSDQDRYLEGKTLTTKMTGLVNTLVKDVRKDFWRRLLNLDEVRKRMTEKKLNEFESLLNDRSQMEFNEKNIRQFVLNLIGSYEEVLTDAVEDIFDLMTIRHCYGGNGFHEKNIWLYSGWKSNKSYRVANRVILPLSGEALYDSKWNTWRLNYHAARKLNDIDIVMCYFDGGSSFVSISEAVQQAMAKGQTKKIFSTYFEITIFKKNTIHLRFLDEGINRRFNIVAGKRKKWLPPSYGTRPYSELNAPEKLVIDAFEGQESHDTHIGHPLFRTKNLIQIAA